MIDSLTLQLFGQFPREVANPSRVVVGNMKRFNNFLILTEGAYDCYTSVYPLSGEIDKIFYDLDGHARALEDAKHIYKHLTADGHIVVPVASGKKGIHIYVLLDSQHYKKGKERLTNAAYQILYSVFGDEYSKTTADPHVIGDVRRITRIPNTRRPPNNNSWCTWLPPEFIDFTWLDVINWCKMPHDFGRVPLPTKTLDDFPEMDISRLMGSDIQEDTLPEPRSSNIFLKSHLRPCLYRAITQRHPRHHTRVASSVDLLKFWSPRDICNMYESLNWVDWDGAETLKQISSCRHLRSFGCKKLISYDLCLVDDPVNCPLKDSNVPLEAMVEG